MTIVLQPTAVTVCPLRETIKLAGELHQKAVLSKGEMNDELRFIFRIDKYDLREIFCSSFDSYKQ